MNPKTLPHAPDPQISARKVKGLLEVRALAPPLHHFNLKAPMSLLKEGTQTSVQPIQTRAQVVLFKIHDLSTANYEVVLYLCDDAETFCEKHKLLVNWNHEKSKLQTQTANTRSAGLNSLPRLSIDSVAPTKNAGFILNRPEEALAEARNKNLPLLIDFFGIWCPPCNELDEVVFSSPEFQKQAAGFIKLKLDSDSPASWKLKSRYQVTGYPTVIFASSKGDELFRLVGFRNKSVFLEYLKNALAHRPDDRPNEKFNEKKETSRPKENQDRAKLLQLIEKDSKTPEEFRALIQLIRKALAEPESSTEDDEYSHADLWTLLADTYEELHEPQNSRDAWNKAATEFRNKLKSGKERGYNLELAHCFWKAGEFEAADKIYQRFENLYPKEFTFYFNHANMKMAQHNWSETEVLARKALEFSYGDNKLCAVLLMAKTLKALGRGAEAKTLIETSLSSFPVPEDPKIRTHRYIKQLRELDLNSSGPIS